MILPSRGHSQKKKLTQSLEPFPLMVKRENLDRSTKREHSNFLWCEVHPPNLGLGDLFGIMHALLGNLFGNEIER